MPPITLAIHMARQMKTKLFGRKTLTTDVNKNWMRSKCEKRWFESRFRMHEMKCRREEKDGVTWQRGLSSIARRGRHVAGEVEWWGLRPLQVSSPSAPGTTIHHDHTTSPLDLAWPGPRSVPTLSVLLCLRGFEKCHGVGVRTNRGQGGEGAPDMPGLQRIPSRG